MTWRFRDHGEREMKIYFVGGSIESIIDFGRGSRMTALCSEINECVKSEWNNQAINNF